MVYSLTLFGFNTTELCQALESGNLETINNTLKQSELLSKDELQEIASKMIVYFSEKYDLDLSNDELFLNNLVIYNDLFNLNINQTKPFLPVYDYRYGRAVACAGHLPTENEIPGRVVLGGIEVFSGILVWILPVPGATQLGVFLIGDGLRRTFDELEIIEQFNVSQMNS